MLALIVWVTVDVVLHISVPNDEACHAESSAPKSLQAGVGGGWWAGPRLSRHLSSVADQEKQDWIKYLRGYLLRHKYLPVR